MGLNPGPLEKPLPAARDRWCQAVAGGVRRRGPGHRGRAAGTLGCPAGARPGSLAPVLSGEPPPSLLPALRMREHVQVPPRAPRGRCPCPGAVRVSSGPRTQRAGDLAGGRSFSGWAGVWSKPRPPTPPLFLPLTILLVRAQPRPPPSPAPWVRPSRSGRPASPSGRPRPSADGVWAALSPGLPAVPLPVLPAPQSQDPTLRATSPSPGTFPQPGNPACQARRLRVPTLAGLVLTGLGATVFPAGSTCSSLRYERWPACKHGV